MTEFGLVDTPIFMAGGCGASRMGRLARQPEMGPVAFQFGTRPL
jgi:hypothetical protein